MQTCLSLEFLLRNGGILATVIAAGLFEWLSVKALILYRRGVIDHEDCLALIYVSNVVTAGILLISGIILSSSVFLSASLPFIVAGLMSGVLLLLKRRGGGGR